MKGFALAAAVFAVLVACGVSVAAVVLGVAGFGLCVLAVEVRDRWGQWRRYGTWRRVW